MLGKLEVQVIIKSENNSVDRSPAWCLGGHGLILIRDSDFFFVPRLQHVEYFIFYIFVVGTLNFCGRRGGLMVSALDSGSNGPGSSPGRGHCVVFLSKALNSHSASLHPGV